MKKSLEMLTMFAGLAAFTGESFGSPFAKESKDREFPKNPSAPVPKNCTKWLCDGVELIVLNGKSVEEKFYRKFKHYPISIQKL